MAVLNVGNDAILLWRIAMKMEKYSVILATSLVLSLPAMAQVGGVRVGSVGNVGSTVGGAVGGQRGGLNGGLGVDQTVRGAANVDSLGRPIDSTIDTARTAQEKAEAKARHDAKVAEKEARKAAKKAEMQAKKDGHAAANTSASVAQSTSAEAQGSAKGLATATSAITENATAHTTENAKGVETATSAIANGGAGAQESKPARTDNAKPSSDKGVSLGAVSSTATQATGAVSGSGADLWMSNSNSHDADVKAGDSSVKASGSTDASAQRSQTATENSNSGATKKHGTARADVRTDANAKAKVEKQ